MYLLNDSVTIVLLGDWNRLYIQPSWVAENVFENEEIEVGVEGRDTVFNISYRKNKVIMKPTQTKVVFSSMDIQEETVRNLTKYASNFLKNAYTPTLTAYGFNIDYKDVEDVRLATVFDNMPDAAAMLDLKYEIQDSQITRKLSKSGKIINVKYEMNHMQTIIHFNEHHQNPDKESAIISPEVVMGFIQDTKEIAIKLGYEIEDE